jgi:D-arabinose 1-dehydrogenase-like Zn-dependent alcohol dehydrogenase
MAASKMTIARVARPGALEIAQVEVPEPAAGQVRIKVAACGVCHSDSFVFENQWPGMSFPRTPGHEVAGTIDALGQGVKTWTVGQRVGVGWAGSHCNECVPCRRGDFINCRRQRITGIDGDGGYAEYMLAPVEAVAALPDELGFAEAAPLLCAGVTTFNALRNTAARGGDLVAVLGIGGLGHLGIQFARKMGFHTVAVSNGADKAPLAKELGAHLYLDSTAGDAAAELQKLGGARVILATAPSGKAMTALVGGLGPKGEMIIIGAAADPLQIPAIQLIGTELSVRGWASGTSIDSEDTLRFAAQSGIRPMIETFPLARAADGYKQMISGRARFRAVLTM